MIFVHDFFALKEDILFWKERKWMNMLMNNSSLLSVVGACRPDWRETDDDVMQKSQIIVDTKEGALEESGDVILSKVRHAREGHLPVIYDQSILQKNISIPFHVIPVIAN